MAGDSNAAKARNKSIDSAKKAVNQRIKEECALEGADKLKFEISHLENIIRNCKVDLAGGFKGNLAISNKMNIAEKQLMEKKEELIKCSSCSASESSK
jgi:hypothetical protein